jgi:aerobic C4-dicarboxylate transport protein
MSTPAPSRNRPLYRSLYVQVLFAVAVGVFLGHFHPQLGTDMKPLGDGFIKLIKMIIAPIIFCTVVVGIAGMEDMKKVGKTGGLALLYFEVVSTIALVVGLIIVNLVQPGSGMHVDPTTLDTKGIAAYTAPGKMQWPRAKSCRCCCSRCCSALRCTSSVAAARWCLTSSSAFRTCCSTSWASS